MPSPSPSRSLLAEVAWRLTLWAVPVVLGITALGYEYVYRREEAEALSLLTAQLVEQAEREAEIFRLAEENAAAWRDRFLTLYADPTVLPDPPFDDWFARDSEGATRLREDFFTGRAGEDGLPQAGTSGFVGNNVVTFDAELRRRLVLITKLVSQYGPGWLPRFTNFHVSLPENALIIHWPAEPWGLKARADLRMTDFTTLMATLVAHNSDRRPVWTPLYYDETAGSWTVTYQLPIDADGRHLANASFDITLTDLVEQLIRSRLDGAVNLVITGDGHLVAGPDLLSSDKQALGTVPVAKLGNPGVSWIYEQVTAEPPQGNGAVRVVSDKDREAWVAITRIDGPDWTYAAIYPKHLVAATAHQAASAIVVISLALFALLIAIVFLVLRGRVAHPIAALETACERMAAGDYDSIADGRFPLPVGDPSEIGLLARSFREMTVRVRDGSQKLESLVSARTQALEAANARLSELSLKDGLTGAFNRRAFDQDLALAFERAKEGGGHFSLLLCDVDHFKRYNDIYGHDAGDNVLRGVVQCFIALVRGGDRVYRVGGEEIAVILNDVDERAARPVAHRIVKAAQDLGLRHEGSAHQVVTVSGGLTGFSPGMADPREMIRLADSKLYRSKQLGRNTLTV